MQKILSSIGTTIKPNGLGTNKITLTFLLSLIEHEGAKGWITIVTIKSPEDFNISSSGNTDSSKYLGSVRESSNRVACQVLYELFEWFWVKSFFYNIIWYLLNITKKDLMHTSSCEISIQILRKPHPGYAKIIDSDVRRIHRNENITSRTKFWEEEKWKKYRKLCKMGFSLKSVVWTSSFHG